MTIDSSVKRSDPPVVEMLAGGGLATLIIFSVGVFMMVVPVIGWIVGPALMLTAGLIAAIHVAEIFRAKPDYAAHCPYCNAPVHPADRDSTGACGTCNHRFANRDGLLSKTE